MTAGYYVSDVRVNSNNKIFVSGRIGSYNGTSGTHCAAILSEDGTHDAAFRTNITSNMLCYYVTKFYETSDSSYIFIGDLGTYSGQPYPTILKVNATGTVDSAFMSLTSADLPRFSLSDANLLNGKILLRGNFSSLNGSTQYSKIAVINESGNVDPTFIHDSNNGFKGSSGFGTSSVRDVLIVDSKVYFVGNFTGFGGNKTPGILKVSKQGQIDESFMSRLDPDLKLASSILSKVFINKTHFAIKATVSGSPNSYCVNLDGTSCTIDPYYFELESDAKFLDDGSTLVTNISSGSFNGQVSDLFAKISSTGQIDPTFAANFGPSPYLGIFGNPRAVITRNSFFVVGDLVEFKGKPFGGLLKYDLLGNPDLTFNTSIGAGYSGNMGFSSANIQDLNMDSAGNLFFRNISSWSDMTYKGQAIQSSSLIHKIKANGDFDFDFFEKLKTSFELFSPGGIKMLPNESIIAWGSFKYKGVSYSIVKIEADGSVDETFLAKVGLSNFYPYNVDYNENNDLFIYGSSYPNLGGTVFPYYSYLRLRSNQID